MSKLPFREKFILALCTTGYNLLGTLIFASLLKFYTDFIGLEPLYYGIAYLIYAVWNGINDIFIGYYSDGLPYHPKKGKRKRLMKLSVPFAVIGFFMLIFNQPTWPTLIIFLVLLLGLCCYDLATTTWVISHAALLLLVTEDSNERASISIIGNIMNAMPVAIMGFIPYILLTGGFSLDFIVLVFSLLGIISFSTCIYAFSKVDEPLRDLSKDPNVMPPVQAVKKCFKYKSFKYNIFIVFTLNGIGGVIGAAIIFLLLDVYGLSEMSLLLLVVLIGVPQPLIAPLVFKILKKIGFRKTFLIFNFLQLVGFLGIMLIVNYYLLFVFYFFITLAGTANGVCSYAYGSIPIYEDYLESGVQRPGMFGGVNAIFVVPATGIFIFIFTIFLTIYGYDETSTTGQTEQALLGIRLGFALPALIFLSITLFLMYKYPIHGAEFEKLEQNVSELYREADDSIEDTNVEI